MPVSTSGTLFWTCLNPSHKTVKWTGSTAICEICGLTSEQTNALIQRGRADERQRIILSLRDQARKLRAATAGHEPGLPAIVLEIAAQVLADQAAGDGPGD